MRSIHFAVLRKDATTGITGSIDNSVEEDLTLTSQNNSRTRTATRITTATTATAMVSVTAGQECQYEQYSHYQLKYSDDYGRNSDVLVKAAAAAKTEPSVPSATTNSKTKDKHDTPKMSNLDCYSNQQNIEMLINIRMYTTFMCIGLILLYNLFGKVQEFNFVTNRTGTNAVTTR